MTAPNPRRTLLILQHPQESREPLSTVPLLAELLPGAVVKVGLSWPNLKAALGRDAHPSKFIALFLGSGLKGPEGFRAAPGSLTVVDGKGAPVEGGEQLLAEAEGIVLIDGSWSQAKTIWWRNAWLLKCKRAILNPRRPSLYGKIRREPRKECLSTLEGAGLALTALGEDPAIEAALIARFQEALAARKAGPPPVVTEEVP